MLYYIKLLIIINLMLKFQLNYFQLLRILRIIIKYLKINVKNTYNLYLINLMDLIILMNSMFYHS